MFLSATPWTIAAEVASGFAVAVAAVLGCGWTWYLWHRHRESRPKAEMSHEVEVVSLNGQWLVRLGINIRNVSKVLLKIESGFARAQLVFPLKPSEIQRLWSQLEARKGTQYPTIDWPLLHKSCKKNWGMELEPGEWDDVYFDFVVDGAFDVIQLYSHFGSPEHRKRKLGWSKTILCDLRQCKGHTMIQLPSGPVPSITSPVRKPEPLRMPPVPDPQPVTVPPAPDPVPRELPRTPDPLPPPPSQPKTPRTPDPQRPSDPSDDSWWR